jgi:chromosome segregation ATPase
LTTITSDRDEKLRKLEEELNSARLDVTAKLNIGLKWQKRTKELMSQINETKEAHAKALEDLRTQVTALQQQVESQNGELSRARQEAETKTKEADGLQSQVRSLTQTLSEKDAALAQASAAPVATTSVVEEPAAGGSNSAEVQDALNQARQRVADLETQLASAVKERDDAVVERIRLQAAATQTATDTSAQQALQNELVSPAEQPLSGVPALIIASVRCRKRQRRNTIKRFKPPKIRA